MEKRARSRVKQGLIEDIVEPHPHNRRSPSVAKAFPEVAVEWHKPKNCGFTPSDFSYGSSVSVFWKCSECKHVWRCAIKHRTVSQSQCPRCVSGVSTDLRDYPKALKQFDFERNKRADPHKLHCLKKYWWICAKGEDHRWKSGFYRRSGERCPYCLGRLASSTNNLTLMPKLAKEYHPTKNGRLKAESLSFSSKRVVWWRCKKGHEWQRQVLLRTQKNSQCPYCTNMLVSKENCFAKCAPKAAKEWHKKKNGKTTPNDVVATSIEKYWFECSKCSREWQASLYNRTILGSGCKSCGARAGALRRWRQ
ncbi:zinc-ribbon domain-containing protein [bacterium]|nr:zinc-ribbon domain-containing protein [bacterium]MBP9808889.1 zinc-ribbon domain-containing protein [bacterium]